MPDTPSTHSTQELAETVRVALDYFEPGDRYADQHEYIVNAHAALAGLIEQFDALREAAAAVVDVGTRKGMLFSTDPETRSDSLVGFYVAPHPFIALQKALLASNPASEPSDA
jgi:hypothetical protein